MQPPDWLGRRMRERVGEICASVGNVLTVCRPHHPCRAAVEAGSSSAEIMWGVKSMIPIGCQAKPVRTEFVPLPFYVRADASRNRPSLALDFVLYR